MSFSPVPNTIGGGGGGGSVIQCPFPLFQNPVVTVRFNAYERGDYRDA